MHGLLQADLYIVLLMIAEDPFVPCQRMLKSVNMLALVKGGIVWYYSGQRNPARRSVISAICQIHRRHSGALQSSKLLALFRFEVERGVRMAPHLDVPCLICMPWWARGPFVWLLSSHP